MDVMSIRGCLSKSSNESEHEPADADQLTAPGQPMQHHAMSHPRTAHALRDEMRPCQAALLENAERILESMEVKGNPLHDLLCKRGSSHGERAIAGPQHVQVQ